MNERFVSKEKIRAAVAHRRPLIAKFSRTLTQKDDVYVRAQPDVVSQVVAWIVWIVIKNDVIAVPEPIIAINNVRLCHLKEEAAKAKAVRVASSETPDMTTANGAGKMPVFPRMVKMVARVMPLMAYPAIIVSVNVRRFRMAFLIAESGMLRLALGWMRSGMRRSMCWRWAMGRDMTSTNPMFSAVLRRSMLRRLGMRLWSALIVMFLGNNHGTGKKNHGSNAKKSKEISYARARKKMT